MGGMPKEGPKRGRRSGGRHAGRSGAVGHLPEYYFSAQHPEFQKAEREFIGFNYSYAPTALDLDELDKLLDKLEERLCDDGEADRAVFEAIALLDLDALHSGEERPRDPHDVAAAFLSRLDEIRLLVWKRIKRWYEDARRGATVTDRKRAAKLLKSLGSALAGSRKGKRAKAVTSPFRMRHYYHQTLFRLELARRLSKVWPCGRSRDERLASVAEAYGLPVPDFLTYRKVPTKEYARILTGKRFGIEPHTVANILSR